MGKLKQKLPSSAPEGESGSGQPPPLSVIDNGSWLKGKQTNAKAKPAERNQHGHRQGAKDHHRLRSRVIHAVINEGNVVCM